MPHIIAALVICCGPGLSGCGPACDHRPDPPAFTLVSPGVRALAGTSMTIEYDPHTGDYSVVWRNGENSPPRRSRQTLDDAVQAAAEWMDELRKMGLTP
jgi:hypothetical protein